MNSFQFELKSEDASARAGVFSTPNGDLETPIFAPVGTQASVKAVTPVQLKELGADLILANTYHLYLRPGDELVASMGGLHEFMGWDGPILTDSGGFQVFSLSDRRQVDQDGVTFRSHLDGSRHRFTPELVVQIQENLGADIIMVLDECPDPYDRAYNQEALERTHDWAERCLKVKSRPDQALFGIVQGGTFPDLRTQSAEFISGMDFSGIAIGGLSVGETKNEMYAILEVVTPILPKNKPRYLMGVGSPDDLVEAVARGIDIFDCVLPTRMARNHAALTRRGRINLRNLPYAADQRPIDPDCGCYTCSQFTRSYLRHLVVAGEMLSATLISIHNLQMLIDLTKDMRKAIIENRMDDFVREFRSGYQKHRPPED